MKISSLAMFKKGYVAKSALGFSRESLTPENVRSDSFQLGKLGFVDISYRFNCCEVSNFLKQVRRNVAQMDIWIVGQNC